MLATSPFGTRIPYYEARSYRRCRDDMKTSTRWTRASRSNRPRNCLSDSNLFHQVVTAILLNIKEAGGHCGTCAKAYRSCESSSVLHVFGGAKMRSTKRRSMVHINGQVAARCATHPPEHMLYTSSSAQRQVQRSHLRGHQQPRPRSTVDLPP